MEAFRASSIVDSQGLTVIAVELIESHYRRSRHGCRLFVSIKPTAVIVCSAAGTYALDMAAQPIDLGELRRKNPRLDAQIENLTRDESDPGESKP